MGSIQAIIQLLILAIGIFIGGGIAYKIEHRQVVELRIVIDKINATTDVLQEQNRVKLEEIKTQAQINLTNWNEANENAIKTTNAYRDMLYTARLRDPNSKVCRDRVSKGSSTRTSEDNATGTGDLSEELSRLLQNESARADRETLDKNFLLKFIQSGCNI
jgi:hypothetical protein